MPTKTKYKKEYEDEEENNETENEREFNDLYDVYKHATTVHNKKCGITEDYILAKSNEAEKKFINSQHVVAEILKNFIKDKTVAKRVSNLIKRECDIKVNLNRNDENNWLVGQLFKINPTYTEEKEEVKKPGFFGRIASALNRKNQEN